METKGLDEILNAEPAEQQAIEPTAEPAADDRPRDEHGRFLPKDTGDTEPEPAAPAEAATPAAEPTNHVPRAALEDERRKRQELERRLQHMESMLQNPQQPAEPMNFWDDPDQALDQRLNQFGQTLIQQWEQRQIVNRANESEVAARAKYPDYEEAREEFVQAAQQNPNLVREMFASPDPAEFAYRRGKQTRELAQVGDLDAYKAKLRAEWEAELKASLPSSNTLPVTTAGMRSAGVRAGPTWSGPKPLSDILNG